MMGVDEFLEDGHDIEETLGQVDDDGTVALDKGNFEELMILMMQDMKDDLIEVNQKLDKLEEEVQQ